MSSTPLRMQSTDPAAARRLDWGAIWSGVFMFTAIWAVFEALAWAILRSTSGPPAMGAFMAVWTVVLSLIALYIAARESARLAALATRHDGMVHGMVMFGLAVACIMVLSSLSIVVLAQSWAGALLRDLPLRMYASGWAWTEFLSLFLGWIAAMVGASNGIERRTNTLSQSTTVRPAA